MRRVVISSVADQQVHVRVYVILLLIRQTFEPVMLPPRRRPMRALPGCLSLVHDRALPLRDSSRSRFCS